MSLPREETVDGTQLYYGTEYREEYDLLLVCNDTLEFLEGMPDETATLVVTSPPYNIGKPYEERVEFKEYLEWQADVLRECVRVLRSDGNLAWEVGNYIEEGEVFPLDIYFYNMLKSMGLKLRNRIVWHFGHGLHASNRFSGRYETILWFTKGDGYIFNLDPVRIPQKYPGKRSYKGPNKGEISSNPKGKNPSDVWKVVLEDWERLIWEIPNVKANHPEKTIHTSQFPIELVERLVLALTNEGDLVFDPFVGVGSAMIAATLHGRRAVGVDKEQQYTDTAYERILAALNGTLKKRPLTRRVWQPKGTEKVARIPPEWESARLSRWVD